MGKVIRLTRQFRTGQDTLISARPWEFRWFDGESRFFIQMRRSLSELFESRRREGRDRDGRGLLPVPAHHVLRGGLAYTIKTLYAYRENEEKMREAYYLAGLIDCMIHQVNPLLRTDLIKDLYGKVMTLKSLLNMNGYGALDRVLFPLNEGLFNARAYRERVSGAGTMKTLYRIIREGTDSMFDILALEYVFYAPGRGGDRG